MEGLRTPVNPPAGVQPQLFSQPAASQALFPQGAVTPARPPQANIMPVSSSPKSVLQQGPEMPQIVLPRTMDNPLKAALSDGANGVLLVDAVTAECGHTFGSASLQKVLAMGACSVCGAPVDSGRLIPNLAVRAAAAAFQVEESLDANLRLKRAREGESARGALPFIREMEQKAFVFPYKLHDRVRVKGNKRTPPHFVGKEAVIVHEGLNGWYTVRLNESGEETRLQYRSLEVLSEKQEKDGTEGKGSVGGDEGGRKRSRTESGGDGVQVESAKSEVGGNQEAANPLQAENVASENRVEIVESGSAEKTLVEERVDKIEVGVERRQSPESGSPLDPPSGVNLQVVVRTEDVARLRGGAPSADSPRGTPSPRPWGLSASDFNPGVSAASQPNLPPIRPTSGTRQRSVRKPVTNVDHLARGISVDRSGDDDLSSGSGEGEGVFEGRGDEANGGGAEEEGDFGAGGHSEEGRGKSQKLLSVPERDRCVKSNGRGWRCKLRKAPGYQYCEHHQRNWDGHEKQWKKAFPEPGGRPEGALQNPNKGVKSKAPGMGGVKKSGSFGMDHGSGLVRALPKVKGMKKPALFLGNEYGFGGNGMTVQKKAKHMAAQRLEKALKDARGAGGSKIGQLYKKIPRPELTFQIGDEYDYDSDEYDLPPQKRGRFLKGELDPHILSQKRIEKAQKYKTLVANKEYIEDDRGNLKVLEVPGGEEPTEEELLAQVERVCPELDLEHLSSVDITAAVAAVAATGREEAEILLGRLLMRHSSKELGQVQDVIDQEKQIVLAKLEDLNRRDAAKLQWKKRPFLGFGEGGPPKKKRSVNIVKTGRVPRLFAALFPDGFGNLGEVSKPEEVNKLEGALGEGVVNPEGGGNEGFKAEGGPDSSTREPGSGQVRNEVTDPESDVKIEGQSAVPAVERAEVKGKVNDGRAGVGKTMEEPAEFKERIKEDGAERMDTDRDDGFAGQEAVNNDDGSAGVVNDVENRVEEEGNEPPIENDGRVGQTETETESVPEEREKESTYIGVKESIHIEVSMVVERLDPTGETTTVHTEGVIGSSQAQGGGRDGVLEGDVTPLAECVNGDLEGSGAEELHHVANEGLGVGFKRGSEQDLKRGSDRGLKRGFGQNSEQDVERGSEQGLGQSSSGRGSEQGLGLTSSLTECEQARQPASAAEPSEAPSRDDVLEPGHVSSGDGDATSSQADEFEGDGSFRPVPHIEELNDPCRAFSDSFYAVDVAHSPKVASVEPRQRIGQHRGAGGELDLGLDLLDELDPFRPLRGTGKHGDETDDSDSD